MINEDSQNNEARTSPRGISAEGVLSYVVIGCFVVAILGILSGFNGNGVALLASAAALGVIAYVYCHKH
jgi:small-conductance mechanosensitive channel